MGEERRAGVVNLNRRGRRERTVSDIERGGRRRAAGSSTRRCASPLGTTTKRDSTAFPGLQFSPLGGEPLSNHPVWLRSVSGVRVENLVPGRAVGHSASADGASGLEDPAAQLAVAFAPSSDSLGGTQYAHHPLHSFPHGKPISFRMADRPWARHGFDSTVPQLGDSPEFSQEIRKIGSPDSGRCGRFSSAPPSTDRCRR